ncbi:MAG: hypothetical protein Q9P01_19120 [Anaerolineae bacterium]|nr:hypothetical protein [Anaerolineae bacterium]MDQ7036863.1 hypothetical protein [Anaerolineae bacterium]
MSEQFTIQLEDKIAQHANEIATLTGESVDHILADKISAPSFLPSHHIDANLAQLASNSDIQLWWLVALGFPSDKRQRMSELTTKDKETGLSSTEAQEHEHLLESYDWYQLLRAEAFVLLQGRGYDVQSYIKSNKPST